MLRPMGRLIVALDGPGSSGKSSVGAAAALEVGYRFCDTGLLYRAVTWLAEARGVAVDDPEGLVGLVDDVQLATDDQGRLAGVLVDGVDVRMLELDVLRRNIGLVFQESLLFRNTVAENIAFGHPDAGREEVERAARVAGAHGFIVELPSGYDTVLEEGAVNLSGGQRQRIAIARALLLEPSILLLDDPTTAVDPETEHEVLSAMDSAMQGRTTFVVANRLSTLHRADLILVLHDGRIIERGTHAELMAERGVYFRAASLQAPDNETLHLLEAFGERA